MYNVNAEAHLKLNTSPGSSMSDFIIDKIEKAKKRVWVMHSIFRDKAMAKAFSAAVRRGVEVKVLIDKGDLTLLHDISNNGVEAKIFKNQGYCGQPQKLHQKVILIDDNIVLCGSVNLFDRSLNKDHESIVEICSEKIKRIFDREFSDLWNSFSEIPKNPSGKDSQKVTDILKSNKSIINKSINILLGISFFTNFILLTTLKLGAR